MRYWAALIVAIAMNVGSNILLKSAVLGATGSASVVVSMLKDPRLWSGVIMAGILLVCYVYAIRQIQISIAYPTVTGLAMVGVAVLSALLLGEPMNTSKVAGIAMVLMGTFILFRAA